MRPCGYPDFRANPLCNGAATGRLLVDPPLVSHHRTIGSYGIYRLTHNIELVPLEDRGAEAVPAPVRPDYELGVSPRYRPRAREVKDRELPIRAREVDVRRVVGPLSQIGVRQNARALARDAARERLRPVSGVASPKPPRRRFTSFLLGVVPNVVLRVVAARLERERGIRQGVRKKNGWIVTLPPA